MYQDPSDEFDEREIVPIRVNFYKSDRPDETSRGLLGLLHRWVQRLRNRILVLFASGDGIQLRVHDSRCLESWWASKEADAMTPTKTYPLLSMVKNISVVVNTHARE